MGNIKATHRLIDSVWTIEYKIVSPTEIEVVRFSRDDPEGYEKERSLPQMTVVENDKREIVGLWVRDSFKPFEWVGLGDCDHQYVVVNPRYVFDYK